MKKKITEECDFFQKNIIDLMREFDITDTNIIRENLRKHIKASGFTLDYMAQCIGFSLSTIYQISNKK